MAAPSGERERPRLDRERGQSGVGRVAQQQVTSHPVRHPQRPGQERAVAPPPRAANRPGRAARTGRGAYARSPRRAHRSRARAPVPCSRVAARHRPGGTRTAARSADPGPGPAPRAGCRHRWRSARTSAPPAGVGRCSPACSAASACASAAAMRRLPAAGRGRHPAVAVTRRAARPPANSGMYRPRNRSSGSGSWERRRSTAWRTRRLHAHQSVEQVAPATGRLARRRRAVDRPVGSVAGVATIRSGGRRGR